MRKTANGASVSELGLDILLVLFEKPQGSGDLATSVGELRGREVPVATFYRQLQRAFDHGWVEIEEPAPGVRSQPGRPERLYRLSDGGERILRHGVEQQRRRVSRASALGLLMGGAS